MVSMAELKAKQRETAEQDFSDFEFEGHDPYDPLDIERVEVVTESAEEKHRKSVRAFLERRQQAYIRVFEGGASAEDCEMVAEDLNAFCFGDATVFHQDERVHCLLTGRQEVIRRIMDHTGLSFDALLSKYTKPATST